MSHHGKLYKQLGDWFTANPDALIPNEGMDYPPEQIEAFRTFFDPVATIDLEGFYLDGSVNRAISETLYEPLVCRLTNLPMIVAIQAGIRGPQLIEIAKHHPCDVSTLAETLRMMDLYEYTMVDANGVCLPLSELVIECVKATSKAFPEQFSEELRIADPGSDYYIAAMSSENAEFWPSSRIAEHMKGMEQGILEETLESFMDECNFNSTVHTDDFLPKDSTGVRYDLFLERSGMLLPEVTRKKVGRILLWEDMLDVAKKHGEGGMGGLFRYCLHDAPEHLRPAIFKGLSGLSLHCGAKDSSYDGYYIFNFFKDSVAGTWLEPIVTNPLFVINTLGLLPLSTWITERDHPDFVEPSGILEGLLTSMMNVHIEEIGASHFQIHLAENLNIPTPAFSKDFKPEPALVHMLKGFESYSLPDEGGLQRDIRLDEWAVKSCVYVAQTLAKRFELDYQAFAGLSSKCVRLLAEAGLDKRRLPRMNARDRGHVVSQELGL